VQFVVMVLHRYYHAAMSNQEHPSRNAPPRWAALLIMIGALLMILSGSGLLILRDSSEEVTVTENIAPSPTARISTIMPTELVEPIIHRLIVPMPTRQATATVFFLPSATPSPSVAEQPTQASTNAPTELPATRQPDPPAAEGTPIAWTQEEKNALSWMCQYEVGGMGSVKYDACLSVISTVRARYVYGTGLGSDVMSVLQWPNQFNIPIKTDAPNAVFIGTVEEYQNGARGSCNGYFYFDSVPGGPSLCVIFGASNQFLDFHNGWG
jgi:hypothetical protein